MPGRPCNHMHCTKPPRNSNAPWRLPASNTKHGAMRTRFRPIRDADHTDSRAHDADLRGFGEHDGVQVRYVEPAASHGDIEEGELGLGRHPIVAYGSEGVEILTENGAGHVSACSTKT
jgi:hypothetical protein